MSNGDFCDANNAYGGNYAGGLLCEDRPDVVGGAGRVLAVAIAGRGIPIFYRPGDFEGRIRSMKAGMRS